MKKFQFPYFDNNATTPIDPDVLNVIQEYNQYYYANPSSTAHPLGIICNTLFQQHRQKLANLLNVREEEVIFTSGSSESINTAIKGLYFQYQSQKNHIISCVTEHAAVLNTLQYLQTYHNAKITLLNVNSNGAIDLNELEKSIQPNTLLVCLMAANNETGVLHPLQDIYNITRKKSVLLFSDTTQWFGKSYFSDVPADIFCGSAHKFHGSKGIGFLVIKNLGRKIFLHPLIHGGDQQKIRSGTIPLPSIAALTHSFEKTILQQHQNIPYILSLKQYFEHQLKQKYDIKINGENTERLVNTSNITFSEKEYEAVLKLMKKFCYSQASACSDGSGKPSHVLQSMGLSKNEIKRTFRFSFSYLNTLEEINNFLQLLDELIHQQV